MVKLMAVSLGIRLGCTVWGRFLGKNKNPGRIIGGESVTHGE